MASDTAGGGRVRLRLLPPLLGPGIVTVQELAASLGVDEEAATYALLELGCRGYATTDLSAWRITERGLEALART
jgi:hypothetical protein